MCTIAMQIWMCWFQGEEDLMSRGPVLNQVALRAWRALHPHSVTLVTRQNMYTLLPDFCMRDDRMLAHSADLLRLMLLAKYGGTWVDMSCIPTMPLDRWLPTDTTFFTFRFLPRSLSHKGNRETVNWFLHANEACHPLVVKWLKLFSEHYHGTQPLKYFQMHDSLCYLYDTDPAVRQTINEMPQISEAFPHGTHRSSKILGGKFDASKLATGVYKRPLTLDLRWYESFLKHA